MRNLSLLSIQHTSFSYANTNWTATALDLDENVLYAASERTNQDGEVEVELWRASQDKQSNAQVSVSPIMASMFTSTISSSSASTSQIVSLHVVPEERKISAIMRGGDVVMVSIDEEDAPAEVEGTFESGILAASWSPDDSLLAIVTGERKLILMTSNFDVISENPLNPEEFGEDAPINVGWGSKQTQFHGSLGKTAAQAPTNVKVGSSPDDDNAPRISWRGDGAFFVVSSLSPFDGLGFRHRSLRVYDRQAMLQSTSEPVAGLEHSLIWRPSGNLIAGTQRFGFEGGGTGREGRHDVIFFERNGLRHGEFTLTLEHFKNAKGKEVVPLERPWGYKIRELLWSSDSNVLSVWIETSDGDIVQLWTTGNYHWYLKHEIAAPAVVSGTPGRFTSVQWHPESALHLILTTPNEVIQRCYVWETYVSQLKPPNDSGLVAVLDGSTILLTPFRTQNIPPPMSAYQLYVNRSQSLNPLCCQTRTPIHLAFSSEHDALCLLWEVGYLEIWALHTRIGPGPDKVMDPSKIWEGLVPDLTNVGWRQVSLRSSGSTGLSWMITVLGSVPQQDNDVVVTLNLQDNKISCSDVLHLPSRNCRILGNTWPQPFQSPIGQIYQHDLNNNIDGSQFSVLAQFPEFCSQTETARPETVEDTFTLFFGLAKSGKLYVTAPDKKPRILASNASSFTLTSSFVVLTATSHESKYVPIHELWTILKTNRSPDESIELPDQWETRKVERGSKIVVVVPSTMSLVLQMPRGNLETIHPRPLVMEVVKQDLDEGNYRKAFFTCRKHRIDLNVLVDHNEMTFLQRISSFVEQIHEVDHLNLFLTLIGRGSQSPETVSRICDSIRIELEKKDMKRYINSILTAHVMKTPPDYEAGLAQLLRIRETDPSLVEDAVKYIIFLVDAERLFDIALGMYDFSLVLLIAQHAQKDPREYLPFLRELRALDQYYQRFRIDDHLKRHQSALKNLSLAAGPEHFAEAIAYIEHHQLYEIALSIWKGTEHYPDVLELYGDWLYEQKELSEAAVAFVEAQNPMKAMEAYEKNRDWQALFDLALMSEVPESDIVAMGYRVAEDLSSKKRHREAGRVLLDYSKDVKEAIIALVQGNAFSEARRITNLNSRSELLQEIIFPASLESCALISEEITEIREQLRKQLHRIRELRVRKIEEPDAFYETEDATMQNIDVMTDASMPFTAFTRYTVAPTSVSRSSKRSSRSKRKAERKVGSGRKGTVDEEEYLLKSLTKLFEKFTTLQAEAQNLLPHLYQFSERHRQAGLEMQAEVSELETELNKALDEIWTKAEDSSEPTADTWASRMAELETNRLVNPIDKVPKPDLSQGKKWRLNLLDLP